MPLVDEKGRLFGVVNVVDLLVVLLAAVVLAGSVVVVFGGLTPPPSDQVEWTTRYATVSTTVPLYSAVTELGPGAELTPVRGDEELRVTDVYRSFAPDGSATLLFRVSYEVQREANDQLLYRNERLKLRTENVRLNGSIFAGNETSSTIDTRSVTVAISVNDSTGSLQDVQAGDRATIGGRVVAEITSINRRSAGEPRVITVEVDTWRHNGHRLLGTRVLRIGQPVTLVTNSTLVKGHVSSLDGSSLSDE